MNDKLSQIPMNRILVNPEGLREVDQENPQFLEMVDSVRSRGVMVPIMVREVEKDGEIYFGLIDGLQRYTASQLCGLENIPASISSMDDANVLEAQIVANAVRVETKHYEYANQINRILSMNPLLTVSELAKRLGKSTDWLNKIIGLVKLDKSVAKLVDEGSINLSNAIALSRLPAEEQVTNIEAAMSQPPTEFLPAVAARIKEIRAARAAGKDAAAPSFVAVPHLRKVVEIKSEIETGSLGPALIREVGASTPEQAFALALNWVLNTDPISVKVAKDKWEAKQKDAAKKRADVKAERAKKAAEAAAKAQAEAEAEAAKAK